MIKTFALIAVACGVLFTTGALAQQGPDKNPMGLDYGPFHPPVPPQVTTYYPPASSPMSAVALRRHHRLRTPLH